MITAALLEQGMDVPDDLLPADVWPVAEPFQAAFNVLSARRQQTDMGAWHRLAYSEIVAYAERNGYAESMAELEEFVHLITAQDGAFIEGAALARDRK